MLTLVGLTGYGAWLDITVRARFEGTRWAVPARIYARPLELYPGRPLRPETLVAELAAAGYHAVERVERPGSYARSGNAFRIATREFRFWDGLEPSRALELEIRDAVVRRLHDGRAPTALARLDPALIGRVYPRNREDRILVELEEVPELLVRGLMAVEDRGFYAHHGVSLRGIARAAWANLRAGAAVQGGSTLTQQLAKNLYLSPRRDLLRKLEEAAIALVLEARYDKRELLEAYLNEVYLGQEGSRAVHGFGLAAWFYFGRRVDELQAPEIALLVGLVRGASHYNPRRAPERARERRDLVLQVMAEQGVLTAAQAGRAVRAPLGILPQLPRGASPHPAFIDLVRTQLARDYREPDLQADGLQIFTTLDPGVQRAAEDALAGRLTRIEGRRGLPEGSLQGAVVVARPDSGEILAVVGDREPAALGFNRALRALRPIGSLVKPAVYLSALERGDYHLATRLSDRPFTLERRGQPPWAPRNYDGRSQGDLPLIDALARSSNLATVRLGLDIGLGEVAATLRRLGVARPVEQVPAMLLGALAMTPLEVTQMYQTLANEGFRSPLRAIREIIDAGGAPLSRYGLQVEKASPSAAVFLLRQGLERVVQAGTARGLAEALPAGARVAGKTGTTDDLRDSWFAGFSQDLLAVVWVGRDDNRPAGLTGSGGAMLVWSDILPRVAARYLGDEPPAEVAYRWTDLSAPALTAPDCPGAVLIAYRAGTEPPDAQCAPTVAVEPRPRYPTGRIRGEGAG